MIWVFFRQRKIEGDEGGDVIECCRCMKNLEYKECGRVEKGYGKGNQAIALLVFIDKTFLIYSVFRHRLWDVGQV